MRSSRSRIRARGADTCASRSRRARRDTARASRAIRARRSCARWCSPTGSPSSRPTPRLPPANPSTSSCSARWSLDRAESLTPFSAACYGRKRMSRGLCVLAATAILASGCASRGAADRLESDVGRLRSELAEMRVAQQATSRDLAAVTSQVQSLDVRTLQDDVARLNRRADALDTALLTKVDALGGPGGQSPAPQRSSVPAPSSTSPVPAPLPPAPAVMSPPPAPLPPDPAAMTPSPAPAPQNRAAIAPPAPLPPPAVMA